MHDAGALPPIRLEVVRKVYHRGRAEAVEAVRDVALTLEPGETVCLFGPSGAGKTTLLHILVGLDRDFEGCVSPESERLTIGMVFQDPRLLPWRSVEDNVRLALPRAQRDRSLDGLLTDFGLLPWRTRFPGELSLGMARRVALVRALAVEPDLLVLDEPFVSLDDRAAAELRSFVFAAVAQHGGRSTVLVTHDLDEALSVADRIVFLTPRPARLLGEVPVSEPRASRTAAWAASMRRRLAAQYPAVVTP